MYLKSYLFRSEMRNVFICNFSALARPAISLEWIRRAGPERAGARPRRGHDARVPLTRRDGGRSSTSTSVPATSSHTFMEWAAAHDFESIFHDMIFILHFIQDFQLYKQQNPGRLFLEDAARPPASARQGREDPARRRGEVPGIRDRAAAERTRGVRGAPRRLPAQFEDTRVAWSRRRLPTNSTSAPPRKGSARRSSPASVSSTGS